ncbi:MAG: enolase C-terminal domain-like protein [Candidatus Nanopelagicales bacterium]
MKISDIQAIVTAPAGIRLVVVKVLTDTDGLYGLGCATFTQRPLTVVTEIEQYLKPMLIGRDPANITDIHNALYLSGYWRGGAVMNNALAGVDQALWDIKGKVANLPAYQLFGGAVRDELATYVHVNGADENEIAANITELSKKGFKNFRVQPALSNNASYGVGKTNETQFGNQPSQSYRLADQSVRWDEDAYLKAVPKLFKYLRENLSADFNYIHDVHERVSPNAAINLAKQLEPYNLFYLEDPVSPDDTGYLAQLRAQTATPIAMGELFTHPSEYQPLIQNRLIDYIRCHVSQIGGVTNALKLTHFAEVYGVKTAWHGPGDVSPVGHAAHLHLGIAAVNFGIQEIYLPNEEVIEVFPGAPTPTDGVLKMNDKPGFGIDIDVAAAKKYPLPDHKYNGAWPEIRRADGSIIKP